MPLQGGPKHEKCVDVCSGNGDQHYTCNFPETTLSPAVGAHSVPYSITRWLQNGQLISLDKKDPSEVLKVVHLPGHTPDSIGILYEKANLFFAGDFVYPYAGIFLNLPHSNLKSYVESLSFLLEFLKAHQFEKTRICCGHVDSNLPAGDLVELWALVEDILAKNVEAKNKIVFGVPCNVYNSDKFELVVCGAFLKNVEKIVLKVASKFDKPSKMTTTTTQD